MKVASDRGSIEERIAHRKLLAASQNRVLEDVGHTG
jgi:hypothetical protein